MSTQTGAPTTVLKPTPPERTHPERIGEYEIVGVIADGGMGRTYRAVQRRLNRPVCIKTLLPQLSSDATVVGRFEREAQLTAALNHPNIVAVHDIGRLPDATPYFVMELVDGISLRELIVNEAPLGVARAVGLLAQILSALAEAHASNLIHRDLKPGNVMVLRHKDGEEVCKVLDFGIARSLDNPDAHHTRTGVVLGTPGYIAPEQISGDAYDQRADLYAAGALFYEMVSGARPHKAASEAELFKKVLLEDPAPPSARTSNDVPAAVDEVAMKALARDPAARYQSATEFRSALQKLAVRSNETDVVEIAVVDTTLPLNASAPRSARSLLSSVVDSVGWDRSKLLEAFASTTVQLVEERSIENLEALRRMLSDLSRDPQRADALREVVVVLREAASTSLEGLLGWLPHPETRTIGMWLLRMLGREGLPRLLGTVGRVDPGAESAVMTLVAQLEPSARSVIEAVAGLSAEQVRGFFRVAGAAGQADYEPLIHAALLSTSAQVRHLALDALSEADAFRFLPLVRQRLHDLDPQVRATALRWVFRLEDEHATDDLRSLLARRAIDSHERQIIYGALAHLGGAAVEALVESFTHERDEGAKIELMRWLLASKHAKAVALARAAACDPKTSPRLREGCVRELMLYDQQCQR
jgi:serine/threonine protein kinase